MFRTARLRLVAWNVIILGLILVFLGLVFYGVFATNIYRPVDQQLADQEQRVAAYMRGEPFITGLNGLPVDPEGQYTVVATDDKLNVVAPNCALPIIQWEPCRAVEVASKPALQAVLGQLPKAPGQPLPAGGASDVRTVSAHGVPMRARTFALYSSLNGARYLIQISRPVVAERGLIGQIRTILLWASLLGILLSGLGSLFLASRALVPIRQAFFRQRQFTADASHELRTPLTLIRANAEMLVRHADRFPEGDGELAAEIIRETDHLNRLVGDLLTLARADAGSLKLDAKPIDLRGLVTDVHDDIQTIAESRGIRSEVSLVGPVRVQGDEVRLRQLLLILLDNAIKYTESGGQVSVSLEREEGRARLAVADTGVGIPAADLPHIFERFYRVDRAREHDSGGTGLGLAIAEWIVQAHNGTIKVDSGPTGGTKFSIELPATS